MPETLNGSIEPLIAYAAFAFLAATTLYMLVLGFTSLRRAAVVQRTAESEREALRAQIERIMDERRFDRERNELSWNGYRKFQIARKVMEGGGICSFYLAPHDARSLPPFHPGQFLTFQLHVPGQPKPVIRCYSLSDSPNHPDYYRVSIKRLPAPRDKPEVPPGLSSNYFHENLNEGDILDVKAPGGSFYLDMTKQTPVVLIGGGVGLTPVLSMLNAIVESGSKREAYFFYGVRNGDEIVMKDHLERLAAENENVHLHLCYSNPKDDEVEGRDFTHSERVSVDLFKRILPSNNYDFYMCGPPPMMNSVTEGLEEWGVPEKSVHFEAFGPASAKKTAPPATAAPAEGAQAITVTFAKSGKSVPWDASIGSILDFAEANGVALDFGCRAGNCGTCITAIKSGEVDYLHEPGERPESGSCLACISVPKADLQLDA